MWARTLHWFLGLKILPTGLGFKVGQNAPFYTTDILDAEIKEKGLVDKSDISNLVKILT